MKTHFLKTLKQRLFLLIAVLGTFISYAQSTPIIGGKKVPPITSFTIITQFDVGGRGDVCTGFQLIGGKSSDGNAIGGRQDIPTMLYGYEIGGIGTSTTCALHSALALAIGGVKPPVGEYTQSEAISCKSTGGAIGGGKSQEPTLLPDGIKPILEVYS